MHAYGIRICCEHQSKLTTGARKYAKVQVCRKSSCCLSSVTESNGTAWACHAEAPVPELPCLHVCAGSWRGASGAGGQWQTALELFRAMDGMGLPRDAITYSSVISALAKGKQWAHALQARPPPLPYSPASKSVGKQWAHVLQARQMSLPYNLVVVNPWANSGRTRCRRGRCRCML